MKYSYHPHAERELEEVEEYYDKIREELGDQFRDEIREAISQILKFPNGFQPLSRVVRRCRSDKFSAAVFRRLARRVTRPAVLRLGRAATLTVSPFQRASLSSYSG